MMMMKKIMMKKSQPPPNASPRIWEAKIQNQTDQPSRKIFSTLKAKINTLHGENSTHIARPSTTLAYAQTSS
jgi:hypothetical protein